MSWPGGCKAVDKADWKLLAARTIEIIWPDADLNQSGLAAANWIAKLFPQARMVNVDGLAETVDGFDAADLEGQGCEDPEAWLRARLSEPKKDDPYAGLCDRLSAQNWISREIPPSDRLLGDLITTTSRMFLVGRTGLGKTMLGLAMAMGMAFGTGFLHWQSSRPARVLYLDGEMPGELLQRRIRDEVRRIGREDRLDNLLIYSTERAEELAARFPCSG